METISTQREKGGTISFLLLKKPKKKNEERGVEDKIRGGEGDTGLKTEFSIEDRIGDHR